MPIARMVGARIKRCEDPRLITGTSTYVDDIKLHDMLYLAILRSVHAHARIRGIDASKALALPGVVAVLKGEDVQKMSGPLPVAPGRLQPILKMPPHYPMAVDKVRHLGEAVAAVVATDRYLARDALDLIEVDYEPLPAVVDAEKAAQEGAPLVHDDIGTNVALTFPLNAGNVEGAFRDGEVKVSQRMVQQRLIPAAMETRGVVADYQLGPGSLTLYSSTQIPHLLRTELSLMLNLPEHKLRVVAPEVGGGFGSKLNVYAEEAIAAIASRKLGKPVKWVEERSENFLATTHGRDQIAYVEAAAKPDGTVTALKLRIIADLGAYHQLLTPVVPLITVLMAPGPYRIANVQAEAVAVFTNKTSMDAYRGAGCPEATYYIERVMDLVATELGMDPVEVRRRNFIPPDAFPYQTATGMVYDSGNYELALNRALEMVGYDQFRREQARLREQGRYLGIGFSSYLEEGGLGPSKSSAMPGWEACQIRVLPTGKVTVLTGVSPHGQGQETAYAQIVADELGPPIDDVVVLHSDTDVLPYGIGTFATRGTAVGGTAVMMSVAKIQEKAKKFAAHLLEARPEDMVYDGGRIYVRGWPEQGMTLQEVAFATWRADKLPPDMEPGLEASAIYEPSGFTFPFGTHVAVIEIDLETGEPKLLRYVAVDDCGKVVNPLLVEGQVHGGIAQGIGQALYEEAVYDGAGQLLSGSFMDYAIPTAIMVPSFETDRTETPSPVNPLGAKGAGQGGTIASPVAVVNAALDALSPFGIRDLSMPLKPERIWRAVQEARARRPQL